MSTEEDYNEKESYEVEEEMEEQKPKKGSRILLVVFVLALVGLNVFLGFNIFNQKKELEARQADIAKVTKEKELLKNSLDSLKIAVEAYVGTISEKDAELDKFKAQLDSLEGQLDKKDQIIKSSSGLRAQLAKYRQLEQEWNLKAKQLDSLTKAYEKQQEISQALRTQVDTLNTKTNQLEDLAANLQNKVELGSRLKTSGITFMGLKVKGGKEKETDKSSQVNKLKICYTVDANAIATKGKRDVYLCIKKGNDILTAGSGTFKLRNEKEITYSIKDQVSYSGQPVDQCTYFDVKDDGELASGAYKVEIYIDGIKVGEQNHSLR